MTPFAVDIYHSHWIEDGTCGAACAQMLIRALKKATQQAVLYCDQCHTPGVTGWRTTPEGLSATLIAEDTKHPASRYEIGTFASPEILTRHLCWLVSKTPPQAPAVLVHGKSHWVVVNGCKISHPPSSSSDMSYDIESLSIKDPGVPKAAGSTALQMHQDVTITDWLTTYIDAPVSGAESELPEYGDKWVAIGEAIPRNDMHTTLSSTPIAVASPQAGTISGDEAAELAYAALDRVSYVEGVTWCDMIGDRELGVAAALRWQDPRFPGDATYFVPFETAAFANGCPEFPAIVQIGENGDYRGLVTVPEGGLYLGDVPYMLEPDALYARFADRPFINQLTGERLFLGEANNDWPTELSWTPSNVSVSPFLPYYIVEFQGGNGPVTVYLRLDGRYYFELDDTIAGW